MKRDDLVALRQRAGNLRSRDVRHAAEAMGYEFTRTSGGHHQYSKRNRRTLVIPERLTSGTAIGIINRLISELDDG